MPDKTDAKSCLLEELEETTRTSLNHLDEDYRARPEVQKPLQSLWLRIVLLVETDVYVWRYALLVVHAPKEEEMVTYHDQAKNIWDRQHRHKRDRAPQNPFLKHIPFPPQNS